ncbi:hypothetical protein [Paenibacillus qinlingensis]|uniref:Uncharacterized protein n=1 Tax=Paenibacillus qinlingensis TaxID=1837343 RepID=A0ABU1P8B3_9BACL|nr:hypothetical protein [Paenibacillus qinlingensis]MDR6555437.1 hypothetical protein [Paenibacillus qinlingensis]
MAGTYGKPDYVPPSGPVDFEKLYIGGVEIKAGGSGKVMNNVKALDIKKELDVVTVAKTLNSLLYELKQAGLMSEK